MPKKHLISLKSISALLFTILLIAATNATEKSKYVLSHSVITTASPETIWGLWEDVENWKKFDTLLEYSTLDPEGTFTSGTNGIIKAEGAPKTKFKLLDVVKGERFTERLYVPLYQIIDLKRRVEVTEDKQTRFTHEVHFKGRLRVFIHLAAASRFKKELPLVMGRLKAIAEASNGQEQ